MTTLLGAGFLGGLIVGVQGPDSWVGGVVTGTHGTHVHHRTAGANLVIDIGREVLLEKMREMEIIR